MQNIPHHKVAIINQTAYVNRMLTPCKWDFKHFAYPSLFIGIIHIWEILIPMLQNTRNLRFRESKKVTQSHIGLPEDLGSACLAAEQRLHALLPDEWHHRGALCRGRDWGTWDLQGFLCQQYQICTRPLGFCRVGPVSGFPSAPRIDFLSMTGL